jgi:hypothetical protein
MNFIKYQHIERFGTDEVNGIEQGTCYVFPKIDGTNASVWLDDNGKVAAGSRNRTLSASEDNAGFYAWATTSKEIAACLEANPNHRLYGEWLVPHSLRTYKDDAWRKFYVFDVCTDADGENVNYLPYPKYKPILDEFGINYIPPLAIVVNATLESIIPLLEKNGFLIKDGAGAGEGVVIKNYEYTNKYKRRTWAKIVTNEFKEKHITVMGVPVLTGAYSMEQRISEDFITAAFIEKEYAKIVAEKDGWQSRYIPELLSRVFHELVTEETWNILKKYKLPSIDFKALNNITTQKVKATMPNLF